MRPTNTLPALRLRNIWRYNVVNIARRQSVAEHSYLTWSIGMHLYDKFVVDFESLERANLSEALLLHDVEEAWSSDIPANLKVELEKAAPGALKRATRALSGLSGAGAAMYATGHWTETLVKAADATEAVLFCLENGAPASVRHSLYDRLESIIESGLAHRERRRFNWSGAFTEIKELLKADPQFAHTMSTNE